MNLFRRILLFLLTPTLLALGAIAMPMIAASGLGNTEQRSAFQEPTPTPVPSGGDTYVTNNYYGINCGDETTPCYVTYSPGYSVPVSITYPVEITTTLPITSTTLPRPLDDFFIGALTVLLAAIVVKFVVIILVELSETNLILQIYRLLTTMVFIAIDIFVLYPLERDQHAEPTIYGIAFALWATVTLIDRILFILGKVVPH